MMMMQHYYLVRFTSLLLLLLAVVVSKWRSDAFGVHPIRMHPLQQSPHPQQPQQPPIRHSSSSSSLTISSLPFSKTSLYMSDEDSNNDEEQASASEATDEDSKDDETVSSSSNEEEEESKVETSSPEVTALKEEIAKLESTLAEQKSKLEQALDECEEYSKTGYARKVADFENMKRVRTNIASSSQSSAVASVLKNFMPSYERLQNLHEKYSNHEFGSSYSELTLAKTFEGLGVTPFHVLPGEEVNHFRMKVLQREESKEFAKDTVLREISTGLELNGNVIQAASCVVSSGSGEEEESSEESGEEAATE